MPGADESFRRYLAGDEGAFDEILTAYREGITYFIYRFVKDMNTAEEIAIDVFAELIIHKRRYNGKASLKTYLYIIARSRAIDYLRHRNKIIISELTENSIKDEVSSPEEEVLANERAAAVNRAVEKLPEDMQEAVYLVYFENLSYRDAAAVMKKSAKQVDNLLYRAKKELKALLTEEGRLLI